MTSLALLIGGLAHGSLARSRVRRWVKTYKLQEFVDSHEFFYPGDMNKPMKKRTILCVDHNEYALPSEQCEGQPQPSDFEPCSLMLPLCGVDENTLNNSDFSDNEIPDTV